jgi:threonine aldolase
VINEDGVIDLRSDTVTLPTEEMLEAIKKAKLGDDVYGEDPTVAKLEELAAEKMGKEAALLVATGTQANLVSLMSSTKRGDQVILEAESHIYWYEVGGLSSIGGLFPWPIKGNLGVLDQADVESAIRPRDIHYPEPTLVCLENTHNRAGGTIIAPSQIKAVGEVAKAHGLALYMDGARIFNAAVASGVNVKDFAKHVDSLMFCLSKGLSCPIGSVVVGNLEFISRARRNRKILGGGMRQAGVIAAPGIIALEGMIDRLMEDHRNARLLAEGLAKIYGISVNLNTVQTNIVHLDVSNLSVSSSQFVQKLKDSGVLALPRNKSSVRMVTHRGIEREDIERTLRIVETCGKGSFKK